jgi:hypothetical protein
MSARKRKGPRRLFRCRRDPQPEVQAWITANRDRLKPGEVHMVEVWHDHDCRYPQGGACTCKGGPEVKLAKPQEN